jgi:hypothetical protein
MGRLAAFVAAVVVWAAPVHAEQPGTWRRNIELPTFRGQGPFVTVPANLVGMPAMILFGGAATAVCVPFDLLRGLSVGGGYGSVAAACGSRAGEFTGSAAYIIGGAPFWVTKQVFWNGPRALYARLSPAARRGAAVPSPREVRFIDRFFDNSLMASMTAIVFDSTRPARPDRAISPLAAPDRG